MIRLRQQDDPSSVWLPVGDTLEVVLEENATTGYLWTVVERPDGLGAPDDEIVPSRSSRPGAGGEHRFQFEGVAAGQGALVLQLRRPWESGGDAIDEFRVELTIGPDP